MRKYWGWPFAAGPWNAMFDSTFLARQNSPFRRGEDSRGSRGIETSSMKPASSDLWRPRAHDTHSQAREYAVEEFAVSRKDPLKEQDFIDRHPASVAHLSPVKRQLSA